MGYRDFSEEVSKNKITESAPVMPDPSYYFKEIITTTNELLGIESDALHSPQIITRYFIHTLFQNENEKFVSSEIFATSTKPFYAYNESQEFVKSDYALKIEAEENPFSLDSRHQNDQIMAKSTTNRNFSARSAPSTFTRVGKCTDAPTPATVH